MKYQILECPIGAAETRADFLPFQAYGESWTTGARFETEPPNPIELTWDPKTEEGKRVSFHDGVPVLMHHELATALRDAGVHNLDTYDVVIRSQTGGPDCRDYVAVNIIGAIRAANLDQSDIEDESDGLLDVLFQSLVIDADRALGQPLFRLAESVSTIVVNDGVAKHITEKGGFGLTFTSPENYSG